MDILVLIPGYNEEKRIGRVISSVRELGFRVAVVDDGSKDATARVAREAGAEVVSYSPNQGKGYALRTGFGWFLKQSDLSAVVVMDSDGQHEPSDLAFFVEALKQGKADVIVGNRMANPEGMPWLRRVTNKTMSGIISFFAGRQIPDSQCGYRALTREAVSRIKLETNRFEIESEMILEAGRKGLRVSSVPIRSVYRDEVSHINPVKDTARFLRFLVCYLFSKKRQK